MAWLNLHHLKYFLVIAEEGSVSAASRKLMVGQPALSAQLKQLEEHLGLQLFERTGKKLILTQEGDYVLRYARAIKQLEDELISNVGHAKDKGLREYVLGAQESVPKSIIAQGIQAICSSGPVKVKVHEGTGEDLFKLLMNGKIDFFLGNLRPMDEGKEMIYISIGKEQVSVWGAKKYSKLQKNFPKSLSGSNFALPGFQNPIRHDFEKYMLETGLHFNVGIEAQDIALLKELAIRGEGLILLGEESASYSAKSGTLIKIGTIPKLSEEYWLGMVKKKIDNEFLKKIMKAFE